MKKHRKDKCTVVDPILPLIRTARKQIEGERGGPLGWAVRFSREDPERWLPSDATSHGYRLLALIYGPLPDSLLQFGSENITAVPPEDVRATHTELSTFFRQLVTEPAGSTITIPTDGLKDFLVRVTAVGQKPAIFVTGPGGGPRRAVLFQAIKSLMVKYGERLLACPTCREPFLALHKTKFCSQSCLQRWHDAKRPSRKK